MKTKSKPKKKYQARDYLHYLERAHEQIQFIRKNIDLFTGFDLIIKTMSIHIHADELLAFTPPVSPVLLSNTYPICYTAGRSEGIKKMIFVDPSGQVILVARNIDKVTLDCKFEVQIHQNDLFWLPVLNATELKRMVTAIDDWSVNSLRTHQNRIEKLQSAAWMSKLVEKTEKSPGE